MTAFWIYRISQTLFIVTLNTNNKILLSLLGEKKKCFSGCLFPANTASFLQDLAFLSPISSFFSQAEGRTFPGIGELSPRSEHPQQAGGVASKVHSIVAAHVEREGKCHVAIQHSDRVEESSGCAL